MRIGLVSSKNRNNDVLYNIAQIYDYCKEAHEKSYDMICFAESFIQGFEGLTWDYNKDKYIAITLNSNEMHELRNIAQKFSMVLSFGFIENDNGILYSSNVVINKQGKIIDVYKRVSVGWKEPCATKEYMEGTGFHTFTLEGKKFTTVLCGDMWDDERLKEVKSIDADVVLWPVYLDYARDLWNNEEKLEYADRVKNIKVPVLMTNSYVELEDRAKGGCCLFKDGKIINEIPSGVTGILEVII